MFFLKLSSNFWIIKPKAGAVKTVLDDSEAKILAKL
jgi:hypothetical protein